MTRSIHPFDPLQPREITEAAEIVRQHLPGCDLNFRAITLREPPKHEALVFLEQEKAGVSGASLPPRCASVQLLKSKQEDGPRRILVDLIVNLDKGTVLSEEVQEGKHTFIDPDFMQQVEAVCLADARIQAEIRKLELPEGATVCVEPWSYATDGMEDMAQRITMPEGPSFRVVGNLLQWEKWEMHVGFNYREGLTLHNVRYDGRSLFYRLSLAEMFHREPLKLPNVVCCHEQDDGILWKHTNFRTGNAVVTRSRLLVLQTIITVGNYEYVFAFHFGQDAAMSYEVRATGILSTCPIDVGATVPYGTIIAPGVVAPFHQHLFCLRIDPSLDGHANSLLVEESHPMPLDDPAVHNPLGTGYTTTSTVVEREAGLDLSFATNRTFKIINENVINPTTGTPIGYKIHPHYSQMIMAHPTSFHAKRSEFGAHAVWVTRYSDEERFAAGRYTLQSTGGGGIASAIARRQGEEGDASVDWPVMPAERLTVSLKPANFFAFNPALDVAVSSQEKNQSVLVCDGSGARGGKQCTTI
ncbi:unnamed protein product [Parascedosporium putredinis]|uniref:Amine oxidase n=1 Tax=Parascedosporium putredinis TaxID=1442378 RepID=A0A9P1GY57_9PEZI|nr:unnamed protein product [Parascedosporium putredinis]CAI7989637.1 unnamed protein product [Parascedosporium putredinis]